MTLARLWILHFLWLLPLCVLALIVQYRRKRNALAAFADSALLSRLIPFHSRGRGFFKGLLIALSLGLIVLALAGPRWGSHYQEVSQKGVDIVILMDVSASMQVEDVKPSRFERARREILDFLKIVQGDRVGLVAFSGAAFIQCPLTLDYAAIQMFLDSLEPGQIPVPGTDLGAAIQTGLGAFDLKAETDKVMLLITDGEDNEKQGLKAARAAAEKQIKIFVFGIGDPSGGPVPAGARTGGFKKDDRGQLVLSKLDEATLKAIAVDTGGTYVRSMAGDMDLDILYFDGIRSRTQARELKGGKIKVYEERFAFFVLAAFVLLLLEGFIDAFDTKPASPALHSSSRQRWPLTLLTLFVLALPSLAHPVSAAENPDDLYRKGQFAEAEKGYARLDMDNPKELRYRYNRGCAAFQNGDAQGAMAAFSSVSKRAQDPALRFNALFNLGNIAFGQGDFESAAAYFRQAVGLNPASDDARHNLELSLRRLAQQQKDKSQPSPEKGDPQKKPADQKNDGEPSVKQPPEGQDNTGKKKKNKPETPPKDADNAPESRPESGPKTGAYSRTKTEDLSGDLKPRGEDPGEQALSRPSDENMKQMVRKKAEALLNNIKEDRAGLLKYQRSRSTGNAAPSGKDW